MTMLPTEPQNRGDDKIIFGLFIGIIAIFLITFIAIGSVLTLKNNNPLIKKDSGETTGELKTIEEKFAAQGELKKFSDYQDFKEYLENTSSGNNNYYGMGIGTRMMAESVSFDTNVDTAEGLTAPQEVPQADGLGGGNEYSPTNIQVAGVDEADIIKTDGEYIYAVTGQKVVILDAVPAEEAKILSEIALEKNSIQNIYINDDRLVIFGYDHEFYQRKTLDFILPRTTFTFLNIYDISNKQNPQLVRELNFEGNYVDSRMIGDYVYFITNKYPNVFAEDILPKVVDGDQLLCLDDAPDGRLCPNIYYFDIPYPSYQLTTVAAINITDANQAITQDAYLIGGTNSIYVSSNAIYLTNTKYLDEYQLMMEVMREVVEPQLEESLRTKIAKIEKTDNDVLNENEKLNKIFTIIQYYLMNLSQEESDALQQLVEDKIKARYTDLADELEKTIIHKISIDKDKMENTAKGEVPGTVLNQFSMDENRGYFRIATTRNRTWSQFTEENQTSYNNIYVLDNNLKTVGKVEHLAEDERIYSVRFMQDRAYMVTFEQVDPLFVIDLSEPTAPKVLGELKIPGFSNYLHPYDNETLIGLGQNTITNEFGGVRNAGVKLSLFDVSDVANPKEIDNYVVSESNSRSLAQQDHKAFLFSRDKDLLVIPVNSWGKPRFNGAMVFKVTKDGFEFRGTIDHARDNSDVDNYYLPYNTEVRRSLYIKNELYTMSEKYIKINNLDDLSDTNTIQISNADINQPVPYPEPMPLIDEVDIIENTAF